MFDKNDLMYWFPKLEETGVPVPQTIIVHTDIALGEVLDGRKPVGFSGFLAELAKAGDTVGYPCFLRAGHGSGKHYWRRTCHVQSRGSLASHVSELVQWSACADFMGLPFDTWAVRKLLPLESSFTAYAGMPVAREFRFFIEGGKVKCWHPYWPEDAVEQGRPSDPNWRDRLAELNHLDGHDLDLLTAMSERVSRAFNGAWSLDWARSTDSIVNGGWFALDMAEAGRSFHWPGCEAAVVTAPPAD